MITAKELFNKMLEENDECTSTELMIEFAKLHVREALNQASEKAQADMNFNFTGNVPYVIKNSILNSYSLDNVQ